ncbi:hypothetical protein [Microbispora sp. H10830]|uniref:hypothetical protein n=1 Tax=Microbispora sp. H10830 TaxID=2729109 RepID=UPI0015FFF7CF|nr:hypothetical protein [Microbispora sp. H10830]
MPKHSQAPLSLGDVEEENKQLKAWIRELELERDILLPGGQVFRRGDQLVSRFPFIADHASAFG